MAVIKVPDLEDILLQAKYSLKEPQRKVPKRIGFAGVDIWLPEYVKEGCEQFIRNIEEQVRNKGGALFSAKEEAVQGIIMAYIGDSADLVRAPREYWLTDEVVRQKRGNLLDMAFLSIAGLVLEQDGMAIDESYIGVNNALNVAIFYFDSILN